MAFYIHAIIQFYTFQCKNDIFIQLAVQLIDTRFIFSPFDLFAMQIRAKENHIKVYTQQELIK